uniref:CCC domain-containing protein n=1 Tax=Graphocephala atropunctata TaxID=36148 RepID=A0A1B6LT82_9HEMI
MWPFLVLLLTESSLASPASDSDDTEYVEHRVTAHQAAAALHLLNLTELEGQGCRPCTERQKGYCLSDDLLMDHCTCDHRHIERLPYVEHTCYVPRRIQPTFASDCLEYVRLLECCCHASLLPFMKKKKHNASDALHLSHYLLSVLLASQWLRCRSTHSV